MAHMTKRLPTVFLTHGGGPCFFMEWNPADAWDGLRAGLESLPSLLPTAPKVILVVSAHWEEAPVAIEVGDNPELVYDYFGFPPHTYELTYPAPGAPDVARQAHELLTAAGIDAQLVNRGWDHGVFIPLKVAYPNADVPIVAMSLQAGLNPATHLAIGKALAPLRDQGVLIVGSGSSYHNMQVRGPAAVESAAQFDRWLHEVLPQSGPARHDALAQWFAAPDGTVAHPREEHLIPLHVAAGAAADEPGRPFFADRVMSVDMSCWIFGATV